LVEHDRQGDVIGIFLDDRADAIGLGIFPIRLVEAEGDRRAVLLARRFVDGEFALAV